MSDRPRSPRRRSLFAALAATLLATAALVIPASSASAVTTVVTCTGTQEATASPGLTNTPTLQTVTATSDYPVCAHVVGGVGVSTMTAVGPTATLSFPASCTELLQTGPSVETVRWSNGQTSTFSTTVTAQYALSTITYTQIGTVSAGLYAGATVVQQYVFPSLGGLTQCAGTGVTEFSGSASFVITQLL